MSLCPLKLFWDKNLAHLIIAHQAITLDLLMNISQLEVEDKIIEIRNKHVIIDSDVAQLYGVETKRINEAVSRNPEKFPEGYFVELNENEKQEVVANCDHLASLKFSPNLPKAFTEKGLYMLATILKSPKATETTLAIIETFTKVREISRTIQSIPQTPQNSPKYQELMQKAGDLISVLVVPENLDTSETEASIEVNLAIVKFKYSVKKKISDILLKISNLMGLRCLKIDAIQIRPTLLR